jgi:hypothetical protein
MSERESIRGRDLLSGGHALLIRREIDQHSQAVVRVPRQLHRTSFSVAAWLVSENRAKSGTENTSFEAPAAGALVSA